MILQADDQNKPDRCLGHCAAMIDDNGVDAAWRMGRRRHRVLGVQQIAKEKQRVYLICDPAAIATFISKLCTPWSFQFVYNTYARWPTRPAACATKSGGSSWFFITADYEFGLFVAEEYRDVHRHGGQQQGAGGGAGAAGDSDFSTYLQPGMGRSVTGAKGDPGWPTPAPTCRTASSRQRRVPADPGRCAAGDAADGDHRRELAGA